MAKKSKRYTEAAALIENGKLYSAEEAIELVKTGKWGENTIYEAVNQRHRITSYGKPKEDIDRTKYNFFDCTVPVPLWNNLSWFIVEFLFDALHFKPQNSHRWNIRPKN